ncbi:MAG: hypothetical protein QM706_15565 [Nitrospira sp.]
MKRRGTIRFSIMIGTLTVIAWSTAPALAKNSTQEEKDTASSSPAEFVERTTDPAKNNHADRHPGPAWRTIGGTVKHIKGNIYTVEDYEGNQIQLYISRETKQLRGNKKVGDRVRAEITHGGFANSIQ